MTKIVALGAGRMGRGIAQVFAYAGYEVAIVDFKERLPGQATKLLEEAKNEVGDNLTLLNSLNSVQEIEIENTLNRIKGVPLTHAEEILAQADYIFEGVPEVLKVKEDVISRVSAISGPDTVIASTTSTILSTTLAAFTSKPTHFLNAHFLNPAYLIPLVEVSPSEETSPEVIDQFIALLEDIGKVPIKCKASPGYNDPPLQSKKMTEAQSLIHI